MTELADLLAERYPETPRETTTVPRGVPAAPTGHIPDGHIGTTQLRATTGITTRQADTWIRHGWIRSTNDRPGSGYARSIPIDEVPVVALMARLIRAGLTPAAAHTVARGATELAPGIRIEIDP